jgi:protein-disulfide isomerase/uncharacterized membrane protein
MVRGLSSRGFSEKTGMEATESKAGKGLWIGMLATCLAGLGVAIELTVLHVRVHLDPTFHSFCAINSTVNCDTVALSPYSVFLGVPVSVWGILGYVVMGGVTLAALVFARRQRGLDMVAGLMLALTGFSVCMSLVLGSISAFALKCFCLLCMITYALNIALLVLAWLEARRWGVIASIRSACSLLVTEWRRMAPVGAFGLITVALLLAFYPAYWSNVSKTAALGLPSGNDVHGDPWIGAQAPTLTIIEYSDYQCPHCRRGHDQMRSLLAKNPTTVQLVHRHYPLDQACNPKITSPFHPYSCLYARMAVCAQEQGKFWQANDYLFEKGRSESAIETSTFAKAIGLDPAMLESCLQSRAAGRVDGNIQEGIRRGVEGTPTYQIGDRLYPGSIPPDVIQGFIGKQP